MSNVIVILIFFFSIGQINAQKIDELVDIMAQVNEVHDSAVGVAGIKTEQFKAFEKLKELVTIDELVELTNHPNPVITCYASWGLVDKNYNRLEIVFSQLLKRNEKVAIYYGCQGKFLTIKESLYLKYFNKLLNQMDSPFYQVSTDSQLFKLDSLILFYDNISETLLNHAFENNTFGGKFLERIKFIAFEQKKFVAMKYIFNNHRNCCEERLAEELLLYLGNNQYVHHNIYREIFSMLFFFDNEELREVIFLRLKILFAMGIFPTSEKEYETYLKK